MGAYRSLAAGVDQANALALHFREIQRFQTWSRALRAFVLRYGVVNTISTCKDLCLVPEETSLWDFQRMLLDDFFPEERFAKKEVHCIRATVKRGVCAYSFIYQDTGGVRRLRVPFFFSTPMGVF